MSLLKHLGLKEGHFNQDVSKSTLPFTKAQAKETRSRIERVLKSRNSTSEIRAQQLIKVYRDAHRKISNRYDSACFGEAGDTWTRQDGLITYHFFLTEKYITDDFLFWGEWKILHAQFEYSDIAKEMTKDRNVYPLQATMLERGTRATRSVDFIEKAGRKFGEAMASVGGWDSDIDNEVLRRERVADGNLRHRAERLYYQSIDGIKSLQEEDDEIWVYRGFWISDKDADRRIRAGNGKTKGMGNELAEVQVEGIGISYSLHRRVAEWFAVIQALEVQENKREHVRPVLGHYKAKRKSIRGLFMHLGEQEVVAVGSKVRLIKYDLDYSHTFSKKRVRAGAEWLTKQRAESRRRQVDKQWIQKLLKEHREAESTLQRQKKEVVAATKKGKKNLTKRERKKLKAKQATRL